eukprot:gene8781-biopygen303
MLPDSAFVWPSHAVALVLVCAGRPQMYFPCFATEAKESALGSRDGDRVKASLRDRQARCVELGTRCSGVTCGADHSSDCT